MSTKETLHNRYNRRSDQIPPVRIRGFKRHDLSLLLAEFGYANGAEIGVAEAIHALDMFQTIPGLSLICVDPYMKYLWKRSQEEHEQDFLIAQDKLRPYNARWMRTTSLEASREIPDGSLDFVYIDGDHSFDAVMLDIVLWAKKVRSGGIIAGHDAYRFRGAGVVDAVSTYTHCHQIHEWFLCDERESDWFWAKP